MLWIPWSTHQALCGIDMPCMPPNVCKQARIESPLHCCAQKPYWNAWARHEVLFFHNHSLSTAMHNRRLYRHQISLERAAAERERPACDDDSRPRLLDNSRVTHWGSRDHVWLEYECIIMHYLTLRYRCNIT